MDLDGTASDGGIVMDKPKKPNYYAIIPASVRYDNNLPSKASFSQQVPSQLAHVPIAMKFLKNVVNVNFKN